jgi:hypothetical protein
MPVSVEYMSDLIKGIPENGLSDEDCALFDGITEECWFALNPMLLSFINKAVKESADGVKTKMAKHIVIKTYHVLRRSRVSCLNDCLFYLSNTGVFFQAELLQNDSLPMEILTSDTYFEKYKKGEYYDYINALRLNAILKRTSEAASLLRKQLREEFPDVDSMTDEMVLSVAGIAL